MNCCFLDKDLRVTKDCLDRWDSLEELELQELQVHLAQREYMVLGEQRDPLGRLEHLAFEDCLVPQEQLDRVVLQEHLIEEV